MENRTDASPKQYSNNHPTEKSSNSKQTSTTSVDVTALDAIVNVNSLFTVAVFIGLSFTSPDRSTTTTTKTSCISSADDIRKLLVYEVVSFSCFLFSSLIAQGLKLAINLLNSKDLDEAAKAHINRRVLRLGMLGSAVGSVIGCLFLMLSMVNVVEIKLGKMACGGDPVSAGVTLIVLVSFALLVYISTTIYAIWQ